MVQIAKKQARTTSKYAIAKYTQTFSTSNITSNISEDDIFFNCIYTPILITRISTKSGEPIANFKPRGKCIWLIARVVAQTSVYCINCAFN